MVYPYATCLAGFQRFRPVPTAERIAHQLQAIRPAPAQTYGPQRTQGAYRPSRTSRPARPVGCMRLLGAALRITLSYMKDAALTIRLDPALERQL